MREETLDFLQEIVKVAEKVMMRYMDLEDYFYLKDSKGRDLGRYVFDHDSSIQILEDSFPFFVQNVENQFNESLEEVPERDYDYYYDKIYSRFYNSFDKNLTKKLSKPSKDVSKFNFNDIADYVENLANYMKSSDFTELLTSSDKENLSHVPEFVKGLRTVQKIIDKIKQMKK